MEHQRPNANSRAYRGGVTNEISPLPLLQAFLELADEGAAATMVTYYASALAQLRGRAVYVQFSNHRELKTDQTHSNNAVSSPTNDVANTSEVCVILLASLLSTNPRESPHVESLCCARSTDFRSLLNTLKIRAFLQPSPRCRLVSRASVEKIALRRNDAAISNRPASQRSVFFLFAQRESEGNDYDIIMPSL